MADVLSSQTQVQHMPLASFSIFMVQRGIMPMPPIMPGMLPDIGMLMGIFIGIPVMGIWPGVIIEFIRLVWVVEVTGKVLFGDKFQWK